MFMVIKFINDCLMSILSGKGSTVQFSFVSHLHRVFGSQGGSGSMGGGFGGLGGGLFGGGQ